MELCGICSSANAPAFRKGSCYICEGKALNTEEMVKEAIALLADEDIRSFSISSIIPKGWFIREERVWDIAMSHSTESVKSIINRTIISSLRNASGLLYSTDGDCRVLFDYSTGRVSIQRNDLFVFGRYKKMVAGLSQSRWVCTKCSGKGCKACEGKGKRYESVEERIGEPLKEAAAAAGYVLHASGREDVDATNSAGRPFVIMLKAPKKRKLNLKAIGKAIGESKEVSVEDLKVVPRGFVEVVTESHFDKSYKAGVEFQKELSNGDISIIKSLEGKMLAQKTPKRVVHRRADIMRYRKVKKIDAVEVKGRHAVLTVTVEAGTYVKELVSGDDGRTEPSISGLLSTKAECKKLEVTGIDDGFIDLCLTAIP